MDFYTYREVRACLGDGILDQNEFNRVKVLLGLSSPIFHASLEGKASYIIDTSYKHNC